MNSKIAEATLSTLTTMPWIFSPLSSESAKGGLLYLRSGVRGKLQPLLFATAFGHQAQAAGSGQKSWHSRPHRHRRLDKPSGHRTPQRGARFQGNRQGPCIINGSMRSVSSVRALLCSDYRKIIIQYGSESLSTQALQSLLSPKAC